MVSPVNVSLSIQIHYTQFLNSAAAVPKPDTPQNPSPHLQKLRRSSPRIPPQVPYDLSIDTKVVTIEILSLSLNEPPKYFFDFKTTVTFSTALVLGSFQSSPVFDVQQLSPVINDKDLAHIDNCKTV